MELVGAVMSVPGQRCLQLQRFMKGTPAHASNAEINTQRNFIVGSTSGPLLFDNLNTLFPDYLWKFKDITEFPKVQLLPPKFQSMRCESVLGNIVFNCCLKIYNHQWLLHLLFRAHAECLSCSIQEPPAISVHVVFKAWKQFKRMKTRIIIINFVYI